MKAVRLHEFNQMPVVDDVPEPTISGPLDVIVKIGGAGVCRTDLHIMLGQWDEAMHTPAPPILTITSSGPLIVGSGTSSTTGIWLNSCKRTAFIGPPPRSRTQCSRKAGSVLVLVCRIGAAACRGKCRNWPRCWSA